MLFPWGSSPEPVHLQGGHTSTLPGAPNVVLVEASDTGFFSPQELLTRPLFPLHLVIALDAFSGPGESQPTGRPCHPPPRCFPPRSWLAVPRSPRTPQDSVLVQTEGSGGGGQRKGLEWVECTLFVTRTRVTQRLDLNTVPCCPRTSPLLVTCDH